MNDIDQELSRRNLLKVAGMAGLGILGVGALTGSTSAAPRMQTSPATTLEDLLAKDAILEKIHLYMRSMDRLDPELGYSIFAEDGHVDYGPAIYQGTGRGFVDACMQWHLGVVITSHQMTNVAINVNGDKAGSETYGLALMHAEGEDGGDMLMGSVVRYHDKWENRDGDWLIVDRKFSSDIQFVVPMTVTSELVNSYRGEERANDPSYEALAFGAKE